MPTTPHFPFKSLAKKLVAASAILFASTAAQARLSDVDCAKEYLEAGMSRGFPQILGKGLDLELSGTPVRAYLFDSNGERRIMGALYSLQKNTQYELEEDKIYVVDLYPDNPTKNKIYPNPQTVSNFVKVARANQEGCGSTTLLSYSNPNLAKAIRNQLAINSTANVSKLQSDWIARLRLQLYYQYEFILKNNAAQFEQQVSDIEAQKQRADALTETVKSMTDFLLLEKGKGAKEIAGAFALGTAITVSGSNSLGTTLNGTQIIPGSAADAMKGVAGVIFFATKPSNNAGSLVGAVGDLTKSIVDDDVQKKLVDITNVGVNCALSRGDVASCVAGIVEINTKTFWDYFSAFKLFTLAPKRNASLAAADYLELYFKAGGDANFIRQKTGIQYPNDYSHGVADYYEKQYGYWSFDREYFANAVIQFMSTINSSTLYIREKIER